MTASSRLKVQQKPASVGDRWKNSLQSTTYECMFLCCYPKKIHANFQAHLSIPGAPFDEFTALPRRHEQQLHHFFVVSLPCKTLVKKGQEARISFSFSHCIR